MPDRTYRRLLRPGIDFSLASAETRRDLEPALIRLGRSLRDAGDPVFTDPVAQAKFNDDPNALAPAGYTYLGQFIDHDLSWDLTPLAEAGRVPVEQTPNPQPPASISATSTVLVRQERTIGTRIRSTTWGSRWRRRILPSPPRRPAVSGTCPAGRAAKFSPGTVGTRTT